MKQYSKSIVLLNFCDGVYGGIESFLLNAFYCLDKNKYEVRFVTCGRTTYEMFRDEIEELGGDVEEIPILASSLTKKFRLWIELRKYFHKINPDIVHINSGTLSLQLVAATAAKKEGVKRVILHSHNFLPNKTGVKEKIKTIIKKILIKYGDVFLACSTGAALWMYPKKMVEQGKVIVIPNGVDTKKFSYNVEKRNSVRKEFDIDDKLVIGNIGRFQRQKNHVFMVKIMQEVVKLNNRAILMLVGEGELKEGIKQLIIESNLQNNIVFLGERKDMDAFLSAIDVFILPSLYEGLPIASIEAQASGLKVILSDKITKEANITGQVIYLPIDDDLAEKKWAEEICKQIESGSRSEMNNVIYNAGFDINLCYKKMIEFYGEESRNDNE